MGRIFISYSHEDSNIVKKVNDFLSENHIFTWFDSESIHESDRWETNISTAIFSCDVFLMFYSKNYRDSVYCNKEYNIMHEKVNRPTIVLVDIDGSKDSFIEHDAIGYQFVKYKKDDIEDLCRAILSNPAIKKCSIIPEVIRRSKESTHFFNALRNLKVVKHYFVLEPLIRFLSNLLEQESMGRFISDKANFSSLQAYYINNDSFELVLQCESDFSSKREENVRNNYIRNLIYAMFYYGRTEFQREGLPLDINFESVFTSANHRFAQLKSDTNNIVNAQESVDKEIYSLLNRAINELYRNISDLLLLINKLSQLYEASKYYESLESRFGIEPVLPYEINPYIIEISRKLFMRQNCFSYACNENCFPHITLRDGNSEEDTIDLKTLIEDKSENVFLRGNYGSGKSYILKKWFIEDSESFYIDLGNPVFVANAVMVNQNKESNLFASSEIIRSFIEQQESTGYKINFYKLYNYSVYNRKITILLDNLDSMSETNKKRVLSEVEKLSHAFRIVFVSTKHDVEEKLSLNQNSNNLDFFKCYEIEPLKKNQIISFLREKIEESGQTDVDCEKVVSELESLDPSDSIFSFFDNFTKLNILYSSVTDWQDFSVLQLKKEFDAKIKVYQNIFESDQAYSISKKIASLFQESVVDIEDVIISLVMSEISELKKISYESESCLISLGSTKNNLRFRDHYPILTNIMGQYWFVNEDVKNYFTASYIHSQIVNNNIKNDFTALQELLVRVKNNYAVLEYLREFDILRDIDLALLFHNSFAYEELVYIVYKIIQYYDGEGISTQQEFLRYANFSTIPDKFFFGAENIERVVVPPCVNMIGRAVFSNMPRLKVIDFAPRGIKIDTSIPLYLCPWAIIKCPMLEKIRFGNRDYKEYEHPLFSQCYSLKSIEIGDKNNNFSTLLDNQLLVSKNGDILYCSVNSLCDKLQIPDGIKIIGDNALSYLKNVTEIYIPKSVHSISTTFSDFCDKLTRFVVDKDNEHFFTDNQGNMYQFDERGKVLFRVPSGLHGSLVIEPDVMVIGSDSISCCAYLEEIVVSSCVRVVENYAFADTYSLKKLQFEAIDNIENFGTYIFLSTNSNVKVIGDKQYSLDEFNSEYCNSLTEVKQKGKLRKSVTIDIFKKYGFEIINNGRIKQEYNSDIVIVRDITLFKLGSYRAQDFNILLIGLTEYNSILKKNTLQAEKYIKNLINENYIDMVVLSRNLPMISYLENSDLYGDLLVVRTGKSSTSATRDLSKIILELGEIK